MYHTAQGDLFVSQADGVQYLPFPPPGPVVLAKSCAASAITAAKATLTCNVNPEGKASSFHYEYVDDATYQADLPNGFEHAHSSAEQPLLGAADFSLREAEAKLPAESLAPETEYHFRIVATNADAPGGNPGEEATFLTKGGAEVLDTWATEVGSDSARGHAEVDPVGLATTGRFQYVDEVSYESEGGFASPHTQTTGGQIHFGNGEGGASGSTQLHSLQPGTTYRYRLVAEDPFGNQVFGPERALHTFAPVPNETACPNQALRSGPAAALPDCRAYEMVSPLDKDGADVITRINVTGFQTELAQSATDGSAFTYSSYRAFADPQGAPFTNQYLAERGKAGWLTASLSPPRDGGSFRDDLENSYKAFSADLSHSWLLQEGEPTLDPCAPVGFANLYRRDGDGAFHALSCAAPPNLEAVEFSPEIEGFSADGEVAVFRVNDALEVDEGPQASAATVNESGAPRPIYQTYVSSDAGELRLVSVLPDGLPSDKDSSAGTGLNNDVVNHHRQQSLAGAVSNDGERVFWTAGTGSGALYLRENATAPQSESGACDEDGKACTQPVSGLLTSSPAYFQQANPQGTKALFTVEAGPLEDNLYRFDVESGGPPELIAEGVIGHILGASEGLSRVYLASTKASPQAEAEGAAPGKPNVYLDEEGQSRFIGTLSGPGRYSDIDPNVGGYGSPIAPSSGVATPKPPIEHTAQASADGQSLVFMSNSPELSAQSAGYDNADAATGTPDTEVFLYDATADGGQGALRCLSCNPGGGRPEGREIAPGENNKPGPFGAATIPLADNDLYRPRYLSSDGGRVFFESFEALVLADTNGAADVYQWEEAGSGACTGKGASYVPASEGCLSLISSGKSPSDSRLLDASASGSDVFFTTAEGLLPGDYGLVDVYDARVNGGFPPPPPPPPACEGDACQGPVTSRDDPTPASASFQGAGDRSERGRRSSRCPAGKRRVRKAGRGRCVKRQRARKDQRRQTHDRRRISR